MTFNKRIFNLSAWIAVLAVIFIPGTAYTEGTLRTEYGFPLRFFTDYHYKKPDDTIWFLSNVYVNALLYLFNVLFIYAGIHILLYVKKRITMPKE
ncbi:hypothetical protein DET54_101157 [Paenibacillus pabuli]|uniref:Uncharacterized protein n=1 Tax=Paenibacillus pabuli TaxID=1472 RepID=A0A855YE02_9BACL|nr:hypothetical protein DET56_103528 [Paenibacillus pabuli]PXW09387.1 hypothetical protein DEU73_103525 [Paenibacillus taichungensis]RAJ02962.1 hypothetical protein DET54_101157 [Paenibacillus pabuli]